MTTGTYGDVELLLTGWLSSRLSGVRVCTELPATLPAQTVQVVRFGGTRPEIPVDLAPVDVDCYTTDRWSSHTLAEQVASLLIYTLPGTHLSGVGFMSAVTISAPSWAPYDNTTVRRTSAAYLIRTTNPI